MAKLYLGSREMTPAMYKVEESVSDLLGLYSINNGIVTSTNPDNFVLNSNITAINADYMFKGLLSEISTLNTNNLVSISGDEVFDGCCSMNNNITSASFPNLTTVTGNDVFIGAFEDCSNLSSVSFPKLETVSDESFLYSTFIYCTSLTSLSFPSLKSLSSEEYQFNNTLSGVTGCTVHFPSNLQSIIGSWTNITNGMGGTNTTILFDLPATT